MSMSGTPAASIASYPASDLTRCRIYNILYMISRHTVKAVHDATFCRVNANTWRQDRNRTRASNCTPGMESWAMLQVVHQCRLYPVLFAINS